MFLLSIISSTRAEATGTCLDFDLSGTYEPVQNSLIGDTDRTYIVEQGACDLKITETRIGAVWNIRFDKTLPAVEVSKEVADHNIKLAGRQADDFFKSIKIENWSTLAAWTQSALMFNKLRHGSFQVSFASSAAYNSAFEVGLQAIFAAGSSRGRDDAMIKFVIDNITLSDSSLLPTAVIEHTSVLSQINAVITKVVDWASWHDKTTLVELRRVHR